MNISVKSIPPSKVKNACLIIGIFEGTSLAGVAKEIDHLSGNAISKLIKQDKFTGKPRTYLPLYHLKNLENESIFAIGCGKPGSLTPTGFKRLCVESFRTINPAEKTVVCYLAELEVKGKSSAWKIRQIIEAARESAYRFDMFKSDKCSPSALKELIIHSADKQSKLYTSAVEQAEAIADGVKLAKNLGNLPSNVCTPSFLADQARALAKDYPKLTVKVLEEKDMQKLGMGALLAVSQGSAEEAKLICLEYKGGKKDQAPVALVGKGVTFDTGGISLKPADSMVGMKYDMCGAASVLGTLKAAAELQLPINVVGVIPAVENMPGGTGYKPEDILTSMSGQTIEVISTDAEGRLILADALTYTERYKPAAVIDIATLTGAVVIALGFHATGIVSNDESLTQDLLQAGEQSNDRGWPLPMWDEYQEQIKSPFADMANTGGRAGGTITAACFLSRFAKKFKWAHLDVAGTAAMMMGTAERMATGRPVPMLVQYLINRCE